MTFFRVISPSGPSFRGGALQTKLNVSFLPITEALQRLESEGLVESRPRIARAFESLPKDDIIDGYVLREALETQAAAALLRPHECRRQNTARPRRETPG